MRILLLLLVLSAPAFSSNCTDNNSCPVECPGTAASTTFTAITNSAYTTPAGTSITSTDCLYSFRYDSATTACPTDNAFHFNPGQCIMNVFKPHGFTNSTLLWVIWYHGGGGSGGGSEGCFGAGNISTTPLKLIQQYLDTPNPVGGKGIGIIEVEYSLSTSPGVATFPQQFRDVACSISYVMAGNLLGFVPQILGYYGPSWGGELSFWAGNIPTSVYGASGTCLSTDARPAASRTVSAWPLMSWAKPNGSSGYDNNSSGAATTAVQNALNCSNQATCQAQDAVLNATPYLNITSGNLSQISRNVQMFQFTGPSSGCVSGDTIVTPFWTGGGNAAYTIAAYQALGLNPLVKVYPQYSAALNFNNACGHEIGLGNVGQWTMGDAFQFLLSGTVGGNAPVGSAAF